MITEFIFGKLSDYGIKKVKEWFDKNKAQKILLKCFEEYCAENSQNCYVDKEAILAVKSNAIQPNYSIQKIIKNLNKVFDKCITTDDVHEAENIKLNIACSYLHEAQRELLELYHIDERICEVKDKVQESKKIIEKNHKEVKEECGKIISALKQEEIQPIQYFIEELDDSRMYWFVDLKVMENTDDSTLYEIVDDVIDSVGVESEVYKGSPFKCLHIQFFEPICQSDFRDYLREINKEFVEYGIGIYGILTHQ